LDCIIFLIFHLLTHAIFKAILFLCAGIIIHGIGGNQDVRFIGEFSKTSPYIIMILMVGNLSLMGFPFLRGFYSKDFLLEYFYSTNRRLILIIFAILATLLTSLYSLRIIFYLCGIGGINISCFNYEEDTNINYPVFIMGVIVIFMGRIFSWIMFRNLIFINLIFEVKILKFNFSNIWSTNFY